MARDRKCGDCVMGDAVTALSRVRVIEGVAYTRFRVRWREAGQRRQLTLWSPGRPWLEEEVARALTARNVPSGTDVFITSV
jgi:hypothetical protein